MRVLFVTNMWPDRERPWYGSFVYSQAESLRDIGVELDVLAIRGYASNWNYVRGAGQALRHGLRGGHDLVHAHYGHSAVVGRLAFRRPLVISYCGDDLLGTPMPGQPDRMSRGSLALAAAFAQFGNVARATITKSQQMAELLPRRVRRRNYVIPNGVDLEMFHRLDREVVRERLGWPIEQKVALFVGNPSVERKNFALAAEAGALAQARCGSFQLRRATGVAPDDMPLWMSAADVLVHPSWSEGSPNVIKEAMACELPIVATPAGDVAERLRGIPGCHVLEPDAEQFATAMLDAAGHWPSRAARECVSELSVERVARRVLAVYEDVVAGARRAR
jgi:glycosyltransferase involved in cell wall biosynthesis